MANAVVASWTACVKELQRLVEAAAAAGPCRVYEGQPYWADLKPYQRCVDKLDTQSPLPHAAWKRLVQEVQVSWAGRSKGGAGIAAARAAHAFYPLHG